MDDMLKMLVEVHRDMGEVKGDMGVIKGDVSAIHDRMDTMIKACRERHVILDVAVDKNTKYRQYIKGAVAMLFLFGAYLGWQLEAIQNKIKSLLQ